MPTPFSHPVHRGMPAAMTSTPSSVHTDESVEPKTACAIVLAGGSGARARSSMAVATKEPAKQFADLGGLPLLAWSLRTLSAHPAVGSLVLVLPAWASQHKDDDWSEFIAPQTHLINTTGGPSRRESTLNGLEVWAKSSSYRPNGAILVHDGARPFVSLNLVDRLLAGLIAAPGAIPALPVTDTLKSVTSGNLSAGPDRNGLVAVQTPQAFFAEPLLSAHRAAETGKPDHSFTDDASILEWAGHHCIAVPGDADNIKITTPDDWQRANSILREKTDP